MLTTQNTLVLFCKGGTARFLQQIQSLLLSLLNCIWVYSHQCDCICGLYHRYNACVFQVLHALERVGVLVFPELWFAFFSAGGAVAGGLGLYTVISQSGKSPDEKTLVFHHLLRQLPLTHTETHMQTHIPPERMRAEQMSEHCEQ